MTKEKERSLVESAMRLAYVQARVGGDAVTWEAFVAREAGRFSSKQMKMETIEVADDLVVEIRDGEPPVLWLHNNDGDGLVVVWPGQILALINSLAQAGGIIAGMVGDEYDAVIV